MQVTVNHHHFGDFMSTLNSGTRRTAKAAFIFFFSADLQIAQSFPPLFSLNQYDALLHDEADGTEVLDHPIIGFL